MSIHKAKGLEFPLVVLAGCQTGTDGRHAISAEALFDWSTGLTGLRVGRTWDLAGLYIAEKARLRAAEEQKRVLYVAMTRAREHLIISWLRPADDQMEVSSPCWTKPSRKTSPPPQSQKPLPSAAEVLNCAWSRKTWLLPDERRAATGDRQKAELAILR